MRTVFSDSEAGRRRLYQTADIVLLLLNQGMSNTVGEQTSHLHRQEGSQKYQMAVFPSSWCKICKGIHSFKITNFLF